MCKLVLVILLFGLLLLPATAQDTPKAEVFGGYQYTHINVATSQRAIPLYTRPGTVIDPIPAVTFVTPLPLVPDPVRD